ncbi:nucleotidyl transferase AbiEii/AbiGii toxin family protein [Sinomicrobium kalidii]|uniref:nucleotidyl transferase AbiEii/AbiGii toxin family protein n=1 Tax=Sinomicrobium kalidii TaxID=2900738 RepID=UPI001E2FE69A|nr:nucleotidyl transferase AbiEii/AbiGii toxin family protein [Sinomicrobium kalidii]UGU15377.1 nucleotidyl transferase AbiEii/AbiGii toxin family protein [Sinomicrobium kalidii]
MILKKEVERIAEQKGVAKTTIDKDWVLGHFVDAIFSIPECRDKLVFKGGTCLKKCYFKNYRFSEDLDFTAIDPDFVLNKKLLDKIVKLVTERTEIPLYVQELKQLKFKDRPTGFSAIVKFWGADHPRNQAPPAPQRWQTSIKIEIILYEAMIFSPENRKVYHEYSDDLTEAAMSIPCYTVQEVLAEKLRALIQRSYTAPRDFYDIWYLSQNVAGLNWQEIVAAFHQKMKFKGLEFNSIDQMINNESDKRLQAAWKNSLGHQIPDKDITYELVKNEVVKLLNDIL